MWWHRMVTPFVVKGAASPQEVNQSLFGVLSRLLTDLTPGQGRYDTHLDLNVLSLPPWLVSYLIKAVALCLVGLLGVPVPDQDDGPARSAAARGSRPGRADDALCLGAELEAPLCDGSHSVQLPRVASSSRRVSVRAAVRPGRLVGAVVLVMAATRPDLGGLFAEAKATRSPRVTARFFGRESCSTRWSPGASGRAARKRLLRPRRRFGLGDSQVPSHRGINAAADRHDLSRRKSVVFWCEMTDFNDNRRVDRLWRPGGLPFEWLREIDGSTRGLPFRRPFPSGRSWIGRFLTSHSVAGQGGPMNQSKELRRVAPSHLSRSRGLGRSHGHERGRRQHVCHHARHRHHGRTGLDARLQDRSDPVHRAEQERPASSSESTSLLPRPPARARARPPRRRSSPRSSRSPTPTGQVIRAQHTKYDRKVAKANKLGNSPTSAVLVTLKVPATGQPAADYSVQVKGLDQTTGEYLVGFYLPGDVAGTGTVTKADIQTIKKDHGHDGPELELQLRRRRQP